MVGVAKARMSKSRRWARQQAADPYVRAAQQHGFRSRSAYKLAAMAGALFRPGMAVVDLGAAPGGWSQVVAARVGKRGCVVAVDRLAMSPLPEVRFIQGDFCDAQVQDAIRTALPAPSHRADVVVSDLSPNLTGIAATDDENIYALTAAALQFATNILVPRGAFLVKTFEGDARRRLQPQLAAAFAQTKTIKPAASRAHSREVYLLARQRITP